MRVTFLRRVKVNSFLHDLRVCCISGGMHIHHSSFFIHDYLQAWSDRLVTTSLLRRLPIELIARHVPENESFHFFIGHSDPAVFGFHFMFLLDSPAPNEIQILRDQVDEEMDVRPELIDIRDKVAIDCLQFLDGKFGEEGVGRGIKVQRAMVNVGQLAGIEGSEAEHPALEDDQLETLVGGQDERAESSPVAEAAMGRFIVDRPSELLRLVDPGKRLKHLHAKLEVVGTRQAASTKHPVPSPLFLFQLLLRATGEI